MDSETIKNLGGTTREVGANQQFLMTDPGQLYFVERGSLYLFSVELEDDTVLGRHLFITSVPAGSMAMGCAQVPHPDEDGVNVGLLAVPALDTVIVEFSRSNFSTDDFDLTHVLYGEGWAHALIDFITTGYGPLPRRAHLLDADPSVPYPAGSVMGAYHQDTVWVSCTRPMRLMGEEDLTVEPAEEGEGVLLPVSKRLWFDVEEDAEVSAFLSPQVLLNKQLWPALDRFGEMVMRFSILARQRAAVASDKYKARAFSARRASMGNAFEKLRGTLGPKDHDILSDAAGQTPLQKSMSIVADSLGFSLQMPREYVEDDDPREAVSQLAQTCGLFSRQISLEPEWWLKDGPPFIGFSSQDRRPFAFLKERSGYLCVDPESGEFTQVGQEVAARFRRHAEMLYMTLPKQITPGGAFRQAMQGRGRDAWILISMAVLGALVSLVNPVIMGHLLVDIIPRADMSMWTTMLSALLAAAIGTAVFEAVRALALLRIEGRVDERLQSAIWTRLVSLPTSFFRDRLAGDVADRANGISLIRQLLSGATVQALMGGVFSIFTFALLFYYSWSLALCAGGLLLALSGTSWFFARAQMYHHRKAFTLQGNIDGFIFQMLSGISKLRVSHAAGYALEHWADKFSKQKRETLMARQWSAAQFAVNSTFTPLSALALFAFIYYQLIQGVEEQYFSLADFLSFNAAFGQLVVAVTGFTTALTTVATAIPLFERVQPILEAQPEPRAEGIDLREISGKIDFVNVSFRYLSEGTHALSGVSFSISPGNYVAFVGPTGSGKSTILRLLLGFEKADTGAVFIDKHDISSLNMSTVRRRMGVVLQNSQLFSGSVFDNIAGSMALTMGEAWAAVRAAGLEKDIQEMPMGMYTVIPEGGLSLSGGQQQRMLIARAMAHKPALMVFDEATSALDNKTQKIVQESMKKISATRVVIAHRLSTIEGADRIYVLDKGKIVEQGRYSELMEQNGTFASLARRQMV